MPAKPRPDVASGGDTERELHIVTLRHLRSSFSLSESWTQAKLIPSNFDVGKNLGTASVKQNQRFY